MASLLQRVKASVLSADFALQVSAASFATGLVSLVLLYPAAELSASFYRFSMMTSIVSCAALAYTFVAASLGAQMGWRQMLPALLARADTHYLIGSVAFWFPPPSYLWLGVLLMRSVFYAIQFYDHGNARFLARVAEPLKAFVNQRKHDIHRQRAVLEVVLAFVVMAEALGGRRSMFQAVLILQIFSRLRYANNAQSKAIWGSIGSAIMRVLTMFCPAPVLGLVAKVQGFLSRAGTGAAAAAAPAPAAPAS